MNRDVILTDINDNEIYPMTFAHNIFLDDGETTLLEYLSADNITTSRTANSVSELGLSLSAMAVNSVVAESVEEITNIEESEEK